MSRLLRPRVFSLAAATALALASFGPTATAHAQVFGDPTTPQTEGPKPEDAPPQPVPVETQPYPEQQPYPAQPYPGQQPYYGTPAQMPPSDPYSQHRFRWGFSVLGGPTHVGDADYSNGGFGGASVRLGIQFNRIWGLYYQGQGALGGYAYANATDAGGVVFASWFNSVVGSAVLWDRLELALGPSLDSITSVSGNVDSGGSTDAYRVHGTSLGLEGRIGVIFGRRDYISPGRAGFSLALTIHPTFIDNRRITLIGIGLGADWF